MNRLRQLHNVGLKGDNYRAAETENIAFAIDG